MNPTLLQTVGAVLFAVALMHTFSSSALEKLAHRPSPHAGFFHLLAEVEVVFAFWSMVMLAVMGSLGGLGSVVGFLESQNFTEPMFVFAIMLVAGTRPVLDLSRSLVDLLAKVLPVPRQVGFFFLTMSLVPLLGSFITEPAAMTLAALMLRDRFYSQSPPRQARYLTLAVLLVNVSIGGVLTSFAAPPVLMVATAWGWDSGFMLQHFGWKAAIAVFINALAVTLFLRKLLVSQEREEEGAAGEPVPWWLHGAHLLLLAGIVATSHHPAAFMWILLVFFGVAHAWPQHQDRLILKEAFLVALFLAGLVVLGSQQRWWLQPVLTSMSDAQVFIGATALTAVTDNAALTYLGSLVPGLSESFKYALVAGAVCGGGLTVVANAPNPAAVSILRDSFGDEGVAPLPLLLAALAPTALAVAALWML